VRSNAVIIILTFPGPDVQVPLTDPKAYFFIKRTHYSCRLISGV
jgi:hypothetical protein